jgi:hypothetical protein
LFAGEFEWFQFETSSLIQAMVTQGTYFPVRGAEFEYGDPQLLARSNGLGHKKTHQDQQEAGSDSPMAGWRGGILRSEGHLVLHRLGDMPDLLAASVAWELHVIGLTLSLPSSCPTMNVTV